MKASGQWDLNVLYGSFEDARFEADLRTAEACLDELLGAQAPDAYRDEPLDAHFEKLQALAARVSEISAFVNLTLLTDQGHAGAKSVYERSTRIERDWLRVKNDFIRRAGAAPDNALALCDNAAANGGSSASADDNSRETLLADAEISGEDKHFKDQYTDYLKIYADAAAHMIPPGQEALVLEMQQTGSRSWQDLRNALDASAAEVMTPETYIENEGGAPLSLPALRNLMAHPDREMRRRAFEAEVRCYKRYELPMAACFSAIKGEAMIISRLRGFPDVLDAMLFENRMDRDTLDAMMASVVRFLPAFHRYFREKGRRMGLQEGLRYYDLIAPERDVETAEGYTLETARALLSEIFGGFHPEMGALFHKAFAEGWIDSDVRQGKVGGALCADLPTKDCSRILVNFTGTSANLCAIAHEMGHAFHSQQLAPVPLMFRDAPTPICETAGLFNETVFREAMLRDCSPDQHATHLEAILAEIAQGVVDIYSRFLFESEAFRRRKDHALDAEELNGMMEAAQQAAYGEGLCADGAHPRMWVCKPHYYIPDYHYYNFPYIVGLLLARGLYAQYRSEPKAFVPSYKQFLSDSCKYDVAKAASGIGIDLRGPDFWDSALAGISEKIEAYIEGVS